MTSRTGGNLRCASQNQGRRGSIRRIVIAFGWNPKSMAPSERMAFSSSTSTSIALGAKILRDRSRQQPVPFGFTDLAVGGCPLVSAAADLYPGAFLARNPGSPMLHEPVIVTGCRSPSRTTTQQITRRRMGYIKNRWSLMYYPYGDTVWSTTSKARIQERSRCLQSLARNRYAMVTLYRALCRTGDEYQDCLNLLRCRATGPVPYRTRCLDAVSVSPRD